MENLTGGTPPVRYLLCVVPCKLYFDTLSRTISVIELPLSILTAIIGAPVFISLLNKNRSNLQ